MDFNIIPMKKEHIDAIVNIEETCFSNPWTKEGIEEELANPQAHFMVALIPPVAGYIGVQEICGEAYITNVAVIPEYRNKGIGKALVTAAVNGAGERKCEFITLEVRKSNAAAIKLYESLGFKVAGMRKNFYKNPQEDALLYTLYFNGGDAVK